MSTHLRGIVLSVLLAGACFVPAGVLAQNGDAQEINAYVLTEAGLAKYTAATRNLDAVPEQCGETAEDGQSLSQVVARLDAIPPARAAIRAAGMTTREYVLFSFSLLQTGLASWGLSQPGGKLPAGISMANVNFYRAHAAAIQQIKRADSDCDDARDEADR
ncbi:MAG: hypothetical protein CMLOHMNK_01302 [Steroidobacteraceae bacterium]|nr:hypothetical protein [Steroidobacteraceae bacterium]